MQVGESVFLTDKFGTIREYTVTESYVVGPYENSIKDQGDKEELTLFTCAENGTKRYVCKCVPKD